MNTDFPLNTIACNWTKSQLECILYEINGSDKQEICFKSTEPFDHM